MREKTLKGSLTVEAAWIMETFLRKITLIEGLVKEDGN